MKRYLITVISLVVLAFCVMACRPKPPANLNGTARNQAGSKDMMELRTADRLLTQRQCAQAAEVYQRYLVKQDKDHLTWNNMGLAYLCDKRYDAAIHAFQQALLHAPTFTDVHNNMGATYMEMKDYQKANSEFEKALLDPNYPVAGPYFNLAKIALLQGKYEQSRALAKRVVAILPKEPAPRLLYSISLENLGRTEEARDSFRELLKLAPDNVEACYHLAVALTNSDPCQALDYYRKVIDLDPLGQLAQQSITASQKLTCNKK